ncbi:hypothetical protein PoB_003943300 [Plakobranchus ocellatus]|uniref:Uncharacterized protein n=1 Tax=Plakobranchus ocellatus TaxID=259542 RepID=A0AAV4B2I9_9GAST|nr:hypothetical protein PoB_003943300 [Plakobranchus ocellatus]
MQDRSLCCYLEHRAETSEGRVRTEWSHLSANAVQSDRCCSRVLPLSGRQYLERLESSAGSVAPGWLSERQCRVNARYSDCYLECARPNSLSVWLWRAARDFISSSCLHLWPVGPLIVREIECAALEGRTL